MRCSNKFFFILDSKIFAPHETLFFFFERESRKKNSSKFLEGFFFGEIFFFLKVDFEIEGEDQKKKKFKKKNSSDFEIPMLKKYFISF